MRGNTSKLVEYIENLATELLENTDTYFSGGYLNSEGWKVIGVIFKTLSRRYPWTSKFARKIRKDPSYENVSKTISCLLELARIAEEKGPV